MTGTSSSKLTVRGKRKKTEKERENSRTGNVAANTSPTITQNKAKIAELEDLKKTWQYCYDNPDIAREEVFGSCIADCQKELDRYNRELEKKNEEKQAEEEKIANLKMQDDNLDKSNAELLKIEIALTMTTNHSLKEILRHY